MTQARRGSNRNCDASADVVIFKEEEVSLLKKDQNVSGLDDEEGEGDNYCMG